MSKATDVPPIVTLHRYFMWSNFMRIQFQKLLKETGGFTDNLWEGLSNNNSLLMYMSYWYGGLYVVIEGWRRLALQDTVIDGLLSSPNVGLLKKYRHAIYHFQPEFFSDKMQAFMKDNTTVPWVNQLTKEFSRFFIDWYKQNTGKPATPTTTP